MKNSSLTKCAPAIPSIEDDGNGHDAATSVMVQDAAQSFNELQDGANKTPATPPPLRVAARRSVAVMLVTLALLGFAWLTLCFLITVHVNLPYNDFGRFYHSTVAFWKADNMYAWNPVVPGIVPGTATLNGEEYTVELQNLNPPHFHLLFLPLALLPIETAYCLWVVTGVLCLWKALKMTARELQVSWTPQMRRIAWVIVLCSAASTEMVWIGQIGWVLLLPVTMMWLAARRGNWLTCGALFGILAATKPFILIFAPYFLFTRKWRALAGAAAGTTAILAVGVLVFGVENYRSWLAALGPADSWAWLEMNGSLWGMLSRSFTVNEMYVPLVEISTAELKVIWLTLCGVMGLATMIVVAGDRSEQRLDRAFALLLVGAVLFCPLGWIYYFPMPLGPLAALLVAWKTQSDEQGHAGWRRWRWWLLALALPGVFCQAGWTRWYQPDGLATFVLGSIFFWTVFVTWLTLMLDGWRHIRLPKLPAVRRKESPSRICLFPN